jgi:hypothetical protein
MIHQNGSYSIGSPRHRDCNLSGRPGRPLHSKKTTAETTSCRFGATKRRIFGALPTSSCPGVESALAVRG